ncbi:sugar ABC transporter permease [Phycicoccus endophyticus]|uniref:Sugar ABC transporter permease n=1 Tax=Phycicoccus endophyticus TaxID=1690220 RepID=A0A7G9R1I8_9MICO|nr:sugar ABC transporter permease [Phycicoccus endophyticus]NHI18749.1 sugar ABC transporter permease [Phycicoccus endophyticus]QNN49463.1 sugar ABC transporter permease [Phycicoccus endophyticus]GGL36804.1 sugar ABC transporter permease [Phycicoccus endophyticus]
MSSPVASPRRAARAAAASRRPRRRAWSGLLWVLPAAVAYGTFVLYPLWETVRYSFFDWDGIGVATFSGAANYLRVLTDDELRLSIVHAFVLIVFFSFLPILVALFVAAVLRDMRSRTGTTVARVVLFIPQVLPLVASGIAWTWMYSTTGPINQVLGALGLGDLARPWLADFTTALPAVGIIGTWVALGFCVVLLSAGIGNIDPALYEATALDGAGWWQQFRHVTIPGLRSEITICLTVTTISALSSFDLVYVSTSGGPGYQTMVPAVEIYRLVFIENRVGQGSALAVVLTVLVLLIVGLLQRIGRTDES